MLGVYYGASCTKLRKPEECPYPSLCRASSAYRNRLSETASRGLVNWPSRFRANFTLKHSNLHVSAKTNITCLRKVELLGTKLRDHQQQQQQQQQHCHHVLCWQTGLAARFQALLSMVQSCSSSVCATSLVWSSDHFSFLTGRSLLLLSCIVSLPFSSPFTVEWDVEILSVKLLAQLTQILSTLNSQVSF